MKQATHLWLCLLFAANVLVLNAQPSEPQNLTVVSVASSGDASSFAVTSDGTLWAFGANQQGRLGDATQVDHHAPVRIMTGVVTVSAEDLHTHWPLARMVLPGGLERAYTGIWGRSERGPFQPGLCPA